MNGPERDRLTRRLADIAYSASQRPIIGTYVHETHPTGLAVYSYAHMPIGSLARATDTTRTRRMRR